MAATQVDDHRDEFEVFGELVARKMRKLSHVIDEEAMELVKHNINMVLMNARGNHVINVIYSTDSVTFYLWRNIPTYLPNGGLYFPGNTQQGNTMSYMSMLS